MINKMENKMELKEINYNGYTITKLPSNDDRYIISNGFENYINFKGETKWRPIRVGSLYSSLEKAKKYINKVAQ